MQLHVARLFVALVVGRQVRSPIEADLLWSSHAVMLLLL